MVGAGVIAILHLFNIAIMAYKNPKKNPSNNIVDKDVYESNVYVFRKPVSPRLALTLLDIDRQPKYTMPVENYMVFVKGRLSFKEALEEAISRTTYTVVERISLPWIEAKKPRRKRKWGLKTRNPFRSYFKVRIGFRKAYLIALCIARALAKISGQPIKCRENGVGRPYTYDSVKVFAALLVKRLFNLSFERLSIMLRENGISLAFSGTSYPCPSTLHRYYLNIDLCYYQFAIILLYIKAFTKYVACFGENMYMALDSCYVRLDHYVEAFYRGFKRMVKASFKFYAWCWLKWNLIAFIAFSRRIYSSFQGLYGVEYLLLTASLVIESF